MLKKVLEKAGYRRGLARYRYGLLASVIALLPMTGVLHPKRVAANSTVQMAQSTEAIKVEADRLFQQGIAQFQISQFTAAQTSWEQALKLYRQIQDRWREGQSLGNIGITYYSLGDYPKALEYHQQSLAIARKLKNRRGEGQSLGNIGNTYYSLGDYPKALEYHQQHLAIAREIKDRLGEGNALGNIGNAHHSLGDYTEAIKYQQQHLAIAREIKDRLGEGQSLGNIGLAYHSLGGYTKAIEYQKQRLVIAREIKDRLGEGQSLGNIGLAYKSLGNYPKAIEYYHQSLAIAREIKDRLGEGQSLGNIGNAYDSLGNYPKAIEYQKQRLAIAREIKDRLGEGKTLNNLGLTLFGAGKLADAETNLRQSIQVFESLRQGLGDSQKVSIADIQTSPYITLQQVLIAQKRVEPALEIAEQGRARAFVELLAQRQSNTTQPQIKPITLAEMIQVAKTENATLVEYSNLYNEQLGIWVINPAGKVSFRQVDLKPLQTAKTPLAKLVALSRCFGITSCETRVASRSAKDTELPDPSLLEDLQRARPNQHLQQLYQLLIQPIAELLPQDPDAKVMFVPQGELFLTPFAALQDKQNQYLIDQHTILSIPSIQVLQLVQKQRQPLSTTAPLIVGNPRPMAGNLNPLEGAESEAIEIAKLLDTKPILAEKATKAEVLKRMQTASLIHLATHGIWDGKDGLNSAIALAPVDGFLTAAEILDLKLKADLVVMSACDSARGKVTGDGVIGLSRSLFTAGVPSIIATLWKVPDEPTKALMVDFYKNRNAGQSKAQALRSAMLTTKKTHPKLQDWAAFLLLGSGE